MEDGQSVHTPRTKRTLLTPLSLRGAQRRGNLPEGKTDVVYTDKIPFPRGISPLRSDCRPHSGRNDIIKPNVYVMRRGRGRPALPTASSALKPDTDVISSVSREISRDRTGTKHICASQMPAQALRREIPRGRNENKRTRYAAGRGRPALPTASSALKPDAPVISSVSREISRDRTGTKHIRASQMPAAALRREIPRSRNETKRIRYAAGRGRSALPTASSALKPDALSFRASVEKSRDRTGTKHIRASPLASGGSPPRNLPR